SRLWHHWTSVERQRGICQWDRIAARIGEKRKLPLPVDRRMALASRRFVPPWYTPPSSPAAFPDGDALSRARNTVPGCRLARSQTITTRTSDPFRSPPSTLSRTVGSLLR